MTDITDVATRLVKSSPAVEADWAVNAADIELPYVATGHLASRLLVIDRTQRDVDFTPLFDEVEHLLIGGGPAMRNLLVVGFLEALQNQAGDARGRWEMLLGPASRCA